MFRTKSDEGSFSSMDRCVMAKMVRCRWVGLCPEVRFNRTHFSMIPYKATSDLLHDLSLQFAYGKGDAPHCDQHRLFAPYLTILVFLYAVTYKSMDKAHTRRKIQREEIILSYDKTKILNRTPQKSGIADIFLV